MEAGAAIESRVLVPSAPCEPRATGGAIAKDLTARFPELAKAIRAMRPDALILDGEVAVCDEQLVSRFEWMRRRPRDQVATRQLEGQDVRHEPLASAANESSGSIWP